MMETATIPPKAWLGERQSRSVALLFLVVLAMSSQFFERRSLGIFMSETKENHRSTLVTPSNSNTKSDNVELICALWGDNMDAWWQMHPDYEPHGENETHTCFRPIPDREQADFFLKIYQNQYHGQSCDKVSTRNLIGVGYAAQFQWLSFGLWQAMSNGVPFDSTHFREGFKWLYSPPYDDVPPEERSWAACPENDMKCYYLPVSNCHPPVGKPQDFVATKRINAAKREDPQKMKQFIWMQQYLQRPNQLTRKHFRDLMKTEAPVLPENEPCSWIHVRRGDATNEQFARNFYPIKEYLDRGNVSTNDNILLLTDDETAIEEATLLYPQYKWQYWNRTRVRGVSKTKDNHIPSKDEAHELLVILGEILLAGKCQKGVHGTSHMVDMFQMKMAINHGLENIQLIQIDEELKHQESDAKQFVKELESKLEEARKKQPT